MEIANFGPFDLALQEFEDVIAQLTVSTRSSPPVKTMKDSVTFDFDRHDATLDPARQLRFLRGFALVPRGIRADPSQGGSAQRNPPQSH
jgi:hypothetical protein